MPQWQNKFATNHCTKEQQDLSLDSGPAPSHCSFVLETSPSSCHVQYLIGILTLQITQHLLLGCVLETLCSLQAEFKGLSFPIHQIHACYCGPPSRSQTFASHYEIRSHLRVLNPIIIPQMENSGGWGSRAVNEPTRLTSWRSPWRLSSIHLFRDFSFFIRFWLHNLGFSPWRANVRT